VMVSPSMPIICLWCSTWLALSSGWNLSFIECHFFWHSGHSAMHSATSLYGIWWPGYFAHKTL
jgi:hypothetical protein